MPWASGFHLVVQGPKVGSGALGDGVHQVVEGAASFHDGSDSFTMTLRDDGEYDLEPVGQDAKDVLHDPSITQPIVGNALFMIEVSSAVPAAS